MGKAHRIVQRINMQTTAWSASQKERLRQLNADENQLRMVFQNSAERNEAYQQIEKTLVQIERDRLNDYFIAKRRPRSVRLEHRLAEALTQDGFVQVTTPIIMSRGHLARMAIDRFTLPFQPGVLDRPKSMSAADAGTPSLLHIERSSPVM
jgi:ABC-type dipeptide/oligopeptide/nickel transport system ATPase subunit